MSYTCSCCEPPRSYSHRRNLRKHQRKYDEQYVFGGQWTSYRATYEGNPRVCKTCLTDIPYHVIKDNYYQRFCSKSCSATFNNTNRLNKCPPSSCRQCGNTVKSGRTYCASSCAKQYRYEQFIAKWLKGDKKGGGTTRGDLHPNVRRFMLEQAQYACSDCGWSKVNIKTGKIPLQVDHINGDSTDHRHNNLRVLCPSCHSLTPTYGRLNIGRGRPGRRLGRQPST